MEKPYNRIENIKTFDVTGLVSALYLPLRIPYVPYWEHHEFSQIFLILAGNGVYTTGDGHRAPFGPGMMIYRPAGKPSIYEFTSKKCSYALISFTCHSEAMEMFERDPFLLNDEEQSSLLDTMKIGARSCEPITSEIDPHDRVTIPSIGEVRGMRLRPDVPDVVLSFIYSSLERFLSMTYCRLSGIVLGDGNNQKTGNYMKEAGMVLSVRQYLAEHIEDHVTVEEICNRFWISQTALSRLFRREFGCGVIEYFTDMKIEEAKKRIVHSPESFTEISEALGFSSLNYFSRVFKAKTGMTPTEYSKLASKRRASLHVVLED